VHSLIIMWEAVWVYCFSKFDSSITGQKEMILQTSQHVKGHPFNTWARGYSLIMFFAITMIHGSIRLLESDRDWKWGVLLVIYGFVSLYTVPTNAYFLFALFSWLGLVLALPQGNIPCI